MYTFSPFKGGALAFHPSKVYQMTTKNSWELGG